MAPAEPAQADIDAVPAKAYLGAQLHKLRNGRRITRDAAADHLTCNVTKISRLESGRSSIKDGDLEQLLDLYGVTARDERNALLTLARKLNQRQWWHEYRDVVSNSLLSYLTLESITETIRTYEPCFIPGLLQTEAYAQALVSQFYPDTDARRRVELRLQRRALLQPRRPKRLWAIIDETALVERIGDPRIMHDQLDFLRHATGELNVMIQVLPSGTSGQTGVANSFSLLRLPTRALPDVVYIEHLTGALFIDDPGQVETYRNAIERLGSSALEPDLTGGELEKAKRRLRST
jgi:transcriptional regulator with XRE-family HTH domain